MTAHRAKPTITPERVAWFSAYHEREDAWGVFHVALSDGNYECGASDDLEGEPDDVREAAAWFELLTPSQRARLGKRCARRA